MLQKTEKQNQKDAPQGTIGKVTPMMEQYVEIKAANPGSLLFYRMGDFYELFFDDAEIASQVLGITLTKRGKHLGQDIPMCGVPFHAAEDYLHKLIALGHKVAVCEQSENPQEAKKRGGSKAVVRRDVIRLVTPGTLTEEKLLDPGQSNFLATLARIKNSEDDLELAIAWIDISTGNFKVCVTGMDRIAADLARINPSEIVYSDSLDLGTNTADADLLQVMEECGAALSAQSAQLFDSESALDRLKAHFDVKTLDGLGNFNRSEISACGGILAYVERTQIGERPPLDRPSREIGNEVMFIDGATRNNLEMTRTLSGEKQGSLLWAIDRTASGGGARLLVERMMNPLTDIEEINHRLDSVSFFQSNATLLDNVRKRLRACPDMPRAISRLAMNRGGPRDLGAIAAALQSSREIVEGFGEALAVGGLPAEITIALQNCQNIDPAIEGELSSTLADELPLLKRDGGFIRQGASAQIDELRQLRDDSRQIIAGLQQQYAESTGVKSLKIRHNNVLGYFVEVTAQNADALINESGRETFIHRQTMANAMRFTTTELADIETKIANAAGQLLEHELARFDELAELVLSHTAQMRKISHGLAVLDVSLGLAKLATEQDFCRPQVNETASFEISSGRHPVVEQFLKKQGGNFVANDCALGADTGADQGAIQLLTGPNMGGKSTYLRQNALISILAQMGSFVPAQKASLGIVDRLFSRVGAADDLARGRSTFMVEMVETAAILNQAGPKAMVILDEIGRGTATYDGLSIAWAAVEHLHEVNKCRTLFATHFHELTALGSKLNRLENITLKVKEWNGDVVFLHEVTKGVADRSYGIQVAKLAGLPEAVLERARNVLHQLENAEGEKSAKKLVDDLPLFSARPQADLQKDAREMKLKAALEEVLPDDLSPREALQKLYELKKLVGKDD